MAISGGPDIIQDGLVLSLDAADRNSYPGSGTVWRDLTTNGYTGTLTNGPTFGSGNSGVIILDGTNDYVDGNTVSALNAYPISMMGWVSFSGSGDFINKYSSGTLNGYRIGLNNDSGMSLYFFTNGSFSNYTLNYDNFSGAIPINTWTHIACVVNSSGGNLYINTSLVGTRAWSGTPSAPTTSTTLKLGTYPVPSPANFLNGRIANVQIYNRALSTLEISQNYNALRSRFNI